jgi:hypothetical protein
MLLQTRLTNYRPEVMGDYRDLGSIGTGTQVTLLWPISEATAAGRGVG